MPKRFTLEEAQRLIPSVEKLLGEAIEFKSTYDEAEREAQAVSERITLAGGLSVDRRRVLGIRRRRDAGARAVRETLEKVQELGCVVKDLDTGLVDFPTLFHGREVYLCWKRGEPAIRYWHGVEEGFAGRKAIDQEFLDHHEGDRAQ